WFVFSSRGRHTRFSRDWSSDVCSSDLSPPRDAGHRGQILEPLPVGSTTRGKASGGFGGFSHGNNPTGTGPGGSRDSGNAGVSHDEHMLPTEKQDFSYSEIGKSQCAAATRPALAHSTFRYCPRRSPTVPRGRGHRTPAAWACECRVRRKAAT